MLEPAVYGRRRTVYELDAQPSLVRLVFLKPNTHRRRRRDSTIVEVSRVRGVYVIRN